MDLAFDDDVIKMETFSGYRWIPLKKASNAEICYLL